MAVDPRRIAGRTVAFALGGVALYYAVWGGEYTTLDLFRLKSQQSVEEQRLAQTRAEVDSLHALRDRLENDPATIETVARERFGMVRDGETLYRFVEIVPSETDSATP